MTITEERIQAEVEAEIRRIEAWNQNVAGYRKRVAARPR